VLRTDRQHRGEADRRVHGIAPADPVPEPEHVGRVDAELGHLRDVRRDRDEMPGHGLGIARALDKPGARALGLGHGLQLREGLGRNDEQCSPPGRDRGWASGQIRAIHRWNTNRNVRGAFTVVLERLVGQSPARGRSPDADVDDGRDPLAGVAGHAPLRTRAAKPAIGRARRGPEERRSPPST